MPIPQMSLYEFVSLVISVLGFIAVIISLHILNKSLRGSTFESSREHLFAFNQILIKYPQLRPYFYEGVDITKDNPYYHQVMAMAENFLDYIDSILIQHKNFSRVWPKNWWEPYFEHIFANSPVLCEYLKSHPWYQQELTELMEKALGQKTPPVQKSLLKYIVKILDLKRLWRRR